MKLSANRSAFALPELLVASAVSALLLAGAASGLIALQRSFIGYKLYAAGLNDGSRLTDYLSRDLRNAIKVSRDDSGVVTRFSTGSLEVTTERQLVITVPNYFVSNIPDNQRGSLYQTPRYSRLNLPAGQSYFPYTEVVTVSGVSRLPNYPGNVQVRYRKRASTPQDRSSHYIRQVYENGVLRSERDIAEKVDSETVTLLAVDERRFRVTTSFAPKWTGETNRLGTRQFATVQLLNKRRD